VRNTQVGLDEPDLRAAEISVHDGRSTRLHPIRPDEELGCDDRADEASETASVDLVEERVDRCEHTSRRRALDPIHERRSVADKCAILANGGYEGVSSGHGPRSSST
jgi:hypothetical protein